MKVSELMENKTYNIDTFQMTMEKNGFPKGFILNRDLTLDECKHIMEHLSMFYADMAEEATAEARKAMQSVIDKWAKTRKGSEYF